uniref:dihydrofolate reductase n=1 Tax=Ditylenchus dipsaci TaxID=166011 RepID=A0A915E1Q7_9BILA
MNMIVAVDAGFGIAKNNDLPWHLPKEYAHFVQNVGEHPVQASTTQKSHQCCLEQNNGAKIDQQVVIANGLDEALTILTESELFKDRLETIWNIGGKDIYAEGLDHPWMHKLVLTRIDQDYECDLTFPDVKWEQFEKNDDFVGTEEEKYEEKGVIWKVTSYTKKK